MFSVIIPYYKKRKYIERCIDAVLAQTYQDFEIILVDDGSQDDVAQLIEEKYSGKVHLIQQENQGVSAARNTGIAAATHDYIAFLDADDYYHLRFLESIDMIISKYNNVEIISTAVTHNKLNNNIKDFSFAEINRKDYFRILIRHHPLLTSSSTVLKKELLIKNSLQFDENLKFGEDTDFWNRYIKKTNSLAMVYVFTKLACYDVNDSNTSITNKTLKPIKNTYFFKLLNTKEPYPMKGENEFYTFYVYRYFIIYYQSILEESLLKEILVKIRFLRYNNLLIYLLLKYLMQDWSKNLLLKIITYYRLLFSKSLKSLSVKRLNY